jgi:hypothetical protein
MGGMSGGPLLLPYGNDDGEWHFRLGGIIYEAHTAPEFEMIAAVRALVFVDGVMGICQATS